MSEPLLQIRNLTKVFGAGETLVRAVDGVSLDVGEGELVLIMGPSGSGKTTLLTMMGGLLRPTAGSVLVDGQDLAALSSAELTAVRCKKVGFIFQSFNLWETLSVQENIELALNIAGVSGKPARDRAGRLLDERGLGHRSKFRSRDLSGGEKQRLSIARALANDPALLLADEPTANLDSRHGRDVMRLLRDISRSGGRAVVVVSHDQRIREVADRVLWLEDGQIRDMARLATDPVCGMSVGEDEAISATFGGQRYFFCSRGCLLEFGESRDAKAEPGDRNAALPSGPSAEAQQRPVPVAHQARLPPS
jgi:putative ABC transport system ATP-binding protein